MANPVWPGTLPQRYEQEGYVENPPRNVVRSPTTKGPVKTRRNQTAAERIVSGFIVLDEAQCVTLDTFFRTTCLEGSLVFDSQLPRNALSVVVARWVSEPQYRANGALYNVTLNLAIQP